VQPSSNLVEITGTSSGAARARDLANAFASAGASALNTQQRLLYAASLRELKTRAPKGTGAAQRLYNQQITRLQVLSEIATPAQVVTPAPLPRSPTSPRPLRNALLAGALGLVIGLLIVYVRDAFDRRLRTAQDIAQELALPMLGHVRHDALGQSPRFNGSQAVSEIDWELFSIMRRNLDFLDERELARVVAVTSPLPEEGKSTVAAFLAFVSAAAGKRTLLIEGDLRRPVFAERLGITRAPGLSDYLAGQVRLEQVVQVVKFGDPAAVNGASSTDTADDGGSEPAVANELPRLHEHELGCIAAGTPTRHPVELLRSDRLRTMLAEVGTAYELVVVDTPPMLSVVDTLELLPEVDAVVVCVRMDKTTRQQAKAGRAALARLPRRPTGLVVTGTRPANDAEYGYYAYES
jgi:receptor protein-tyrosine kinase